MPRRRPPYLLREVARGKTFWYFRRNRGLRIRIHGDYMSPEFLEYYRAALTGSLTDPRKRPVAAQGSLAWLVTTYQDSSAWGRLAVATKRQRNAVYKTAIGRAGEAKLAQITRRTIETGVEDRAKTPHAANSFLKAMRALFIWAKKRQLIDVDPTENVRGFAPKTQGFHTWTEEEITRFEARWPIGTRERLALSLLLFTGLRRGDAALLGRQHIRNHIITFRTSKSGQTVTIPVLPELARIIDASPTGDLALIATEGGRPMAKDSFGNWFSAACRAAGVRGTAHGLRKACATRFAEHGATEEELKSWFGWSESRTASIYTRKADRVKLARRAMEKLRK